MIHSFVDQIFVVSHPNPGTPLLYKVFNQENDEIHSNTESGDFSLSINQVGAYSIKFYDIGNNIVGQESINIDLIAPESGAQDQEFPAELVIFSTTFTLPYVENQLALISPEVEDAFTATPGASDTVVEITHEFKKPVELLFSQGDFGKDLYVIMFDPIHKTLLYRLKNKIQRTWLKNFTLATVTLTDIEIGVGILEGLNYTNSTGTRMELSQYLQTFALTLEDICVMKILQTFLLQKAQVVLEYNDNSVDVKYNLDMLQSVVDKMEEKFSPINLVKLKLNASSNTLAVSVGGRKPMY